MSYEQASRARAAYLNLVKQHEVNLQNAIEPILRYLQETARGDFSMLTTPYFQVDGGPILARMSLLGLEINFAATPYKGTFERTASFVIALNGQQIGLLDQGVQGGGRAVAERIFEYAEAQYHSKANDLLKIPASS